MVEQAPLIETRGLTRIYPLGEERHVALDRVDLTVERGSLVAIMGPSGSGKSTLMNLLGGLDRPDAGEYRLEGQRVSDLSADALARWRNQRIGFVFQQFNLLPRTPAWRNVALPLEYAGVPTAERRERAMAALAQVGLSDRVEHWPSQLSGGQQQRVAIARALINQPELILADEPTGALDTRTGLEIMAVLQALNRQGVTLIIVTHEPEIAAYAERCLMFRDGRIRDDYRQTPRDAQADLAALTRCAASLGLQAGEG